MPTPSKLTIKVKVERDPVSPLLESAVTKRNTLLTIRVTRDAAEDTRASTMKLRRPHNSPESIGRLLMRAVKELYKHAGASSPVCWPPELWQFVIESQPAKVLKRDGWASLPTHSYLTGKPTNPKQKHLQRATIAERGVWAAGVVCNELVRHTLNIAITHKPSGLCLPPFATSAANAITVMERLEAVVPKFAATAAMDGEGLFREEGMPAVIAVMQQCVVDGLLHALPK